MLALLKKNFTLGVLFEKWVGPDDRNSKNHIIQVRLLLTILKTESMTRGNKAILNEECELEAWGALVGSSGGEGQTEFILISLIGLKQRAATESKEASDR